MRSLQWFASAGKALNRAEELGTTLLKQTSFGQALSSPFAMCLRRLLRSGGFQDVPECARKALAELWSGMLYSKLVEDLNKQWRGREQRTITNKVIARMEAWQTPSHHNSLASYQRSEGHESPALQPPSPVASRLPACSSTCCDTTIRRSPRTRPLRKCPLLQIRRPELGAVPEA